MTARECPICGRYDCCVKYSDRSDSDTKPDLFYSGYCRTCGEILVHVDFVSDMVNTGFVDRSEFMGCLKRHSIMWEQSGAVQVKPIRNRNDLVEGVVRPHTPSERVKMLIEYISSQQKALSDFVQLDSSKDYPICFARDESNFRNIIALAHESGYIEIRGADKEPTMANGERLYLGDVCLKLTPEGQEKVNELKKQREVLKKLI